MKNPLWQLSQKKIENTNLFYYSKFLKKNLNLNFEKDYQSIWNWSVNNPISFWKSVWDFTKVKGSLGTNFFEKSNIFFKNKFFPEAKLNYAENLLRKNDKTSAIVFKSENGYRTTVSWEDLNLRVSKLSDWLVCSGVKKGDRVAAYLPNIPEAVVAYLGTSSIGAIWSSCSPDFGTAGGIERFAQIDPKILFIGDKYFYNGKKIKIVERLNDILKKIPSINKIVIVPYPGTEIEKNNNVKKIHFPGMR